MSQKLLHENRAAMVCQSLSAPESAGEGGGGGVELGMVSLLTL